MKRMKSVFCILLAAALLLLGGCTAAQTPLIADTVKPPAPPTKAASVAEAEIGQVVELGHYEQDNNIQNDEEPILWLIIHKEEDRALAVSLYGLDNRPYHDKNVQSVTWGDSSLRTWLNDTFYNAAFKDADKARILETELENPANTVTDIAGGEKTTDRLFVLSIGEANQYLPNTHDTATSAYRAVWPTDYAVAQGAFQNYDTGNSYGWLRAPGRTASMVARMSVDGEIDFGGSSAYYDACVVRPAMWLTLS